MRTVYPATQVPLIVIKPAAFIMGDDAGDVTTTFGGIEEFNTHCNDEEADEFPAASLCSREKLYVPSETFVTLVEKVPPVQVTLVEASPLKRTVAPVSQVPEMFNAVEPEV